MSTAQNVFYSDVLVATTCGECGIPFGLPLNFHDNRYNDGKTFYCPNGHNISWRETEATRLKAQLDQMKADRDYWQHQRREELERLTDEKRRHAATKGQLTKTRKRAEHGVCLHCKRSFANVARHVAHMHPEVEES